MTRHVCVEPLATAVECALCILSVMRARLREGCALSETCRGALLFTGKVVMLTGVTPAIGVVTWGASPIKRQADMRWLLAFMFRWNMLGALVLLPAPAHFLLRPSALQASAADKASVQLSGETA
jgi:predicted RND superfamily exporter protein